MDELGGIGKLLVYAGVALAAVGGLLIVAGRTPGVADLFSWLGRLPGDISIKRDNVSFYFPLATSVIVSLLLSLLVYLVNVIGKR